MTHWLVDGNNVMGTRPDGWWRDRPAARRRLVRRLAGLQQATGEVVQVVFDGRAYPDEVAEGEALGVPVRFAPGRRDAADDVIVELVRSAEHPGALTVVTSDAELVRRVTEAGALTVGTSSFLRGLDG